MKKISFSLLIGAILVLASCESGSGSSGTTETWNDSDSTVNSVHHVHSYPSGTDEVVIIHHVMEESSNSGNSSSESHSHLHSYSHPIYISHPTHVSHPVHISHH